MREYSLLYLAGDVEFCFIVSVYAFSHIFTTMFELIPKKYVLPI